MIGSGFKQLDAQNWLQPDPAAQAFVHLSPEGHVSPLAGEDWLRELLAPQLAGVVPSEVQRLYEAARGAMAYGYFYYPLYTLAWEQLFRVVETAINQKCLALGFTVTDTRGRSKTFATKLDFLLRAGAVTTQGREPWEALWQMRNTASHPQDQALILPTEALLLLSSLAGDINALFL